MDSYEMGRIDGREEMREWKDKEILRLREEKTETTMLLVKALKIMSWHEFKLWKSKVERALKETP